MESAPRLVKIQARPRTIGRLIMSDEVKQEANLLIQQANELAAAPEAASEVVEEAVTPAEDGPCPRCGWSTAGGVAKPLESDIQDYIRSVLAGKPFAKKYSLYGGKVVVTLSGLTGQEATRLSKILDEVKAERAEQEPSGDTSAFMLTIRLKVLFYVRSVGSALCWGPPKATTLEEARAEYEDRFSSLSEALPASLVKLTMEYQGLVEALVDAGFDEDFYRGAGQV